MKTRCTVRIRDSYPLSQHCKCIHSTVFPLFSEFFSINFCYCNFVVSLFSIDNIWFRKPIFFSITCTRRWQLRKPLPWTYSEIKSFEENSIEFFFCQKPWICKTILIIISPFFFNLNKSCFRIRFLWNTI